VHGSSFTVENTIFASNSAESDGGGIHTTSGTTYIDNCLFYSNSSGAGGGVANMWGTVYISNCTMNGNNGTSGGRSISGVYDTTYIYVIDSIMWGNTGGGSEIYESMAPTIEITYSDVQGGWADVGIINVDPLFVSGAHGNYYLNTSSLCVDAGSDTASNVGMDIYTTRADNALDVGIVDMGYHYWL
jgi:predicted outer membrane repeat protein